MVFENTFIVGNGDVLGQGSSQNGHKSKMWSPQQWFGEFKLVCADSRHPNIFLITGSLQTGAPFNIMV